MGRQTTIHEGTWLVRIDHKISDKSLLYGRAQRDISLWNAPASFWGASLGIIRQSSIIRNYMIALQHTFTPTVFNEVKFYINRSPFHNPGGSILPFNVSSNDFVTLNNTSTDVEAGSTFGVIDNLRHGFAGGMRSRPAWNIAVRLNQGQTSNNVLTFGETSIAQASLSNINYIRPGAATACAANSLCRISRTNRKLPRLSR